MAWITLAVAVALAIVAVLRWHANTWGAAVWMASFVAMLAIRTPHSLRNRQNVIVAARRDLNEKLLLYGMFLTMMVLPRIEIGASFLIWADYALPDYLTSIGAVLQAPALYMFWRAHADLGRNWSPGLEVREDHGLVNRGVYARVRHPMYAAIWLFVLTQPLLIHNWIAGVLVIPAFAAMWLLRVPREEALMRQTFGAAYEEYCRHTGRLLPKLSH
jgi:protein-S-isoprenylcysteine O-methyltransferase Ste14